MEDDNIIELTDEDGDILKAQYLDTIELDGNEYIVMEPIEEESLCECGLGFEDCICETREETVVIIMKVQNQGDEEFLVPIEDENELERAFLAFQEQSVFCQ